MASPTRWTSGITQAAKWQPLGEVGIPDPFFYAYYDDDFIPYNSALYTVTAAGGSVAALPAGNLAPPTIGSVTTSTTGGTLAAATYFYKVVATNAAGVTTTSAEGSVTTTGTTSSNTINYTLPTGATGGRVYRGTATNAENVYYTVGAGTTSFLDTGAANTAGTPPTTNTASAGNGGRIILTTGTTASNFAEIQLPSASLQYVAGKKLAYLVRLQVGAATAVNVIAGLCNTTATPFASISDGIYFAVTYGSANIVLIVAKGSVIQSTMTMPITLTNNADIDLGFYVDRLGNIKAIAGTNLEGFRRQDFSILVPNGGILASAISGGITTTGLNPTLAVSNGAGAVAQPMISDFQFAGMER